MSVRRLIVEIDPGSVNVSEFCLLHGISRWFFYDLRRRYAVEGEAALEPKSTAPIRVVNRTPDWVEDKIIEQRKELENRGLDAGPMTIHYHLEAELGVGLVPSTATIWRILGRRGFIVPEPKKAPKSSMIRFVAERANECWQLDDIDWPLADGTGVFVITMVDDCTRLCPGLLAVENVNGDTAFQAFTAAGARYGFPERFLSDNATEYKKTLATAVGALGVDHRHGRPNHPQTQGKVERFHETLQKWLRKQPPARTLKELQAQLDEFRHIYNHERPHQAIGRKTPASIYDKTPKSGPADRAIGTPTSIHHITISHTGLAYISKTYTIPIGVEHARKKATIIITGTSCHVFTAGQLIREHTLDPTRRYQPLYDQPGNPHV